MKIKSQSHYKKWWRSAKAKHNLPGDPWRVYTRKGSWKSWPDFLGKI